MSTEDPENFFWGSFKHYLSISAIKKMHDWLHLPPQTLKVSSKQWILVADSGIMVTVAGNTNTFGRPQLPGKWVQALAPKTKVDQGDRENNFGFWSEGPNPFPRELRRLKGLDIFGPFSPTVFSKPNPHLKLQMSKSSKYRGVKISLLSVFFIQKLLIHVCYDVLR